MNNIAKKIKHQKDCGRLGHAYLILGNILEASLIEIFQVGEPDTFRLTESPIKINHIRELSRWIQLKPHSSPHKLAIVYRAESMTGESANALLKILEEPPSGSVLVLQAKNKNRILPTVLSRCQTFKTASVISGDLPAEYLTPEKISQKSIKERFDYANILLSSENLLEILNGWEDFYRKKMLEGESVLENLRQISQSKDLLLTNSSVKLLLENLLLAF